MAQSRWTFCIKSWSQVIVGRVRLHFYTGFSNRSLYGTLTTMFQRLELTLSNDAWTLKASKWCCKPGTRPVRRGFAPSRRLTIGVPSEHSFVSTAPRRSHSLMHGSGSLTLRSERGKGCHVYSLHAKWISYKEKEKVTSSLYIAKNMVKRLQDQALTVKASSIKSRCYRA